MNKVSVVDKFSDVQISQQNLVDIPLFATQIYADLLLVSKGYNTVWFIYQKAIDAKYVLPFAVLKRAIFSKGVFLTSTLRIGDPDISEQDFLDIIIVYIKEYKLCDWIQQPPNYAIFQSYPTSAEFCPFGTYKIDLQKFASEHDLFGSFKKGTKQAIHNAEREGIVIKKGLDNLEIAYTLIKNTMYKAKLGFPAFYDFKREIEFLDGNIQIYCAFHNDKPQVATIFYSSKFCTYAMYSGSIPKAIRGANVKLDWLCMIEARRRNVRYLDFVGARIDPPEDSKYYRIQRYKAQFSGELHTGYLWKMTISPFKYKIYKILTYTRCFLKMTKVNKDIIDQETVRFINRKDI